MVDELVLDQTQIHHLVHPVAQAGVVRIILYSDLRLKFYKRRLLKN